MSFVIDPDLLGLVDKVALVTGGGGVGMGRAHCIQLARAGCYIVVADIDNVGGQHTVEEVKKLGRKAVFIEANVRKSDQVKDMVQKAFQAFGRLDIAVNHVGNPASMPCSFLDYTGETWDDTIEQNLKTTLLCCQAESLVMIEHDTAGRIINVASGSGVIASPTLAAYGAAKAGVIHLTKTLAVELAPYNIRVNCIVPGLHMNDNLKRMLEDPDSPEGVKQFFKSSAKTTPLGRLGENMETAGLSVFFASKLSDYVTGQSLLSDGGVTLSSGRSVGGDMKPEALRKLGKG